MIDWAQMQTQSEREHAAAVTAYESAVAARRSAYTVEADPLRLAAEYDAIASGQPLDLTPWVAVVAAIKQRIPLPPLPDGYQPAPPSAGLFVGEAE